jgi:hypothetical protein
MKTLIKIQGELKAPKNQKNTFGNYMYRSCEDILEAVKPLLVQNECLLTLSDKVIEVGGVAFIEATATFIHGEFTHSVTASARHANTKKGMDDSQITGSTSSYARKYALNGLFCIDDTKDSDATNKGEESDYTFGKDNSLPWVTDKQVVDMIRFIGNGKKEDVIKSLVKYRWSKKNEESIINALDNAK